MMPSFCSSICANTSPIFEACFASFTSRNLPWRYSATSRALRSFSTARNSSPALGEPCRPSTCTGIDGAALSTGLPFSSNMARTRPNSLPAMIGSPSFSVPRLHEHRCHRTAALLDRGFDDDAGGEAIGRRREFEHFGLQQDGVQQRIDALAGLRRHLHEHVRCRPILRR